MSERPDTSSPRESSKGDTNPSLSTAWALLTAEEQSRLEGNLRAGYRGAAVEQYEGVAQIGLAASWWKVRRLAKHWRVDFGTDAASVSKDPELSDALKDERRSRLLWQLIALTLIAFGTISAWQLEQLLWLRVVVPVTLFALGAIATLKIRAHGVGAGLIVLGGLLIVVSGVLIVGLEDVSPDSTRPLYGLSLHLASSLLLAAGCGLAILVVGWQGEDAATPAPLPDDLVLARRRARKVARLSVLVTVFGTSLALHLLAIDKQLALFAAGDGTFSGSIFDALFRYLLAVPLIGVCAALSAGLAADDLRSAWMLILVPLVATGGARLIVGPTSAQNQLTELALLQILASLLGAALLLLRGLGRQALRENPLVAVGIVIALLTIPALLLLGVLQLLFGTLVDAGLLTRSPQTWIPFVVTLGWTAFDIAGGRRRASNADGD